MSDTARSKSDIATLFADNSTEQISPQDLRDFMESCHLSHGMLTMTTPTATVVPGSSIWVLAAGTTALASGARNFDMPSNMRLRYIGLPDVRADVNLSFTFETATVSEDIEFALYLNGTEEAGSSCVIHAPVANKDFPGSINWQVSLSENDYLELYLNNQTGSGNPTVNNLQFCVTGHFA